MTSADPAIRPRGHSATMAHANPDRDARCDFPTWPWAGRAVGELIRKFDSGSTTVWEPASNRGFLAHGLEPAFGRVLRSEKYDYEVHVGPPPVAFDFLSSGAAPFQADWIVTNPPFGPVAAFTRAALDRARVGVAMLVRMAFLETEGREILLYGPQGHTLWSPFVERLPLVEGRLGTTTAAAYAWILWVLDPALRARIQGRPGVLGPRPLVVEIPSGTRDRLSRPSDQAFARLCRGRR